MKRRLYLVTWIDAYNSDNSGWVLGEDEDKLEDYVVYSVGFLGRQNKHYIELLGTVMAETGQYCNPTRIPRGCIVSKKQLAVREIG